MTDQGLHEALAGWGYTLGVDGEVDQARDAVGLMSKRAEAVEAAQARAEAAWRAAHPGQEPSVRAVHGWHHQAWEETRRPKPKVKKAQPSSPSGSGPSWPRPALTSPPGGTGAKSGRRLVPPRWPRWAGTNWREK